MALYRFNAVLDEEKSVHIVVSAEAESEAFHLAEKEIERSFLKMPEIHEIMLLEKKLSTKGGFVLQEI
ncbi:DUF3906 family protein [Texcoconibacillus texcoconensis]|uniref:Ribosome-binding ATPase YchF (GTP1/OBG family) n=1 Tax=Texcoconibacillus texcoconensis TaxID=1095777 RepID=A0A840QLU2_9BACI|nr:DUF3906 family protein [Texcoconibacillus texcoconensis]MBB5172338.1 ribosome-binding ATPase YchF (GTP1/OBG family) [Texcoconibacillus texcoconensis]